jgi:hypothetical protein
MRIPSSGLSADAVFETRTEDISASAVVVAFNMREAFRACAWITMCRPTELKGSENSPGEVLLAKSMI